MQVEVLDDPDLAGKPIAVQQFNSGGFVAVSYEAKAAGVKKGDGVGAGGLASIPNLQKIGAPCLAPSVRASLHELKLHKPAARGCFRAPVRAWAGSQRPKVCCMEKGTRYPTSPAPARQPMTHLVETCLTVSFHPYCSCMCGMHGM